MITVKQIQRLWAAKTYNLVLEQLLAPRSEASARLTEELAGKDAAAAMLVIRLDELSQVFVPLYSEAIRTLVGNQRPDGGWGDPMATALALRALLCGNGHGSAIDRGLEFLADLQKPEGIWPNASVRRLPADPFASAFILMQLGDHARFRHAVRFDDAIGWFKHNELALDEATKKLWQHARVRCSPRPTPPAVVASATPSCADWDRFPGLVSFVAEN